VELQLFKLTLLFLILVKAASLQAASFFSDHPSESAYEERLTSEQKRVWNRLLHMRGGHSQIDETKFFISDEGISSPAQELEAFIKEVKLNQRKWGRFKLPIACAYPARIKFLLDAKLIKKAPEDGDCLPWKKWQEEISPEALSIIFSTAYPNNPGSMFGHTFLRFHKKAQVNDLLDYGANFSALVDPTDWGPVYALKGMFGGYPGFFDLSPYYIKVNEYNHNENRDLIEYELNLSEDEVSFILAHLWELYNGTYFDYYFTWENCSYHLAELISVVKEMEAPHRWYYLPADLIWAITKKTGFVRRVVQRKSLKKKTLERINQLDEDSFKEVEKVKEGAHLSSLGASVKKWDALIEWLNFEKYEYKGNVSTEQKDLLYLSLKKRATLKKKSEPLSKPELLNRPELGHKASRLGLGVGKNNDKEFIRVEYRSGFHDLLANDLGFDPYSEFQFLKGSLLYMIDDKKLKAEDFTLVSITSLDPWTKISKSLSWKVGAKIETMNERRNCFLCHRVRTYGKLGLSAGSRNYILALFGGGALDYSNHFSKDKLEAYGNIEAFAGYSFSMAKLIFGFDHYFNLERSDKDIYNEIFGNLNIFIGQDQELRLKNSHFLYGKSFKEENHKFSLEWGYYF
tara:strand:+ start:408 stop:2291 length:1884 start_codon:yes stop_codon:yes gene_type:complete